MKPTMEPALVDTPDPGLFLLLRKVSTLVQKVLDLIAKRLEQERLKAGFHHMLVSSIRIAHCLKRTGTFWPNPI